MSEPTIRDVAGAAGVSIATVSRALTGQDVVSEETRLKVEDAARQLHYRVNSHARSLRSSRSHTVGLLVSDVRNPFFAQLAHRIQTDLAARGYATFIGSAAENQTRQDAYLSSLLQHRIDGVIVTPQGSDSQVLRQMIDMDLPVVFVDRTVPELGVPFVDSDPAPGIRQAIEVLFAASHKKIGFIAGPLDTSTGRDRLEQFQLIAPGIIGSDNALIAHGGFDENQSRAALEYLVGERVDALIFGYSPNTFVALRQLHRLGIVPGRDIGLVSFDDIETFVLMDPPIAVISQQIDELGATAVRMLTSLMQGDIPVSSRIPTTFIARRSIGGLGNYRSQE